MLAQPDELFVELPSSPTTAALTVAVAFSVIGPV
jgi:hypothetical protein